MVNNLYLTKKMIYFARPYNSWERRLIENLNWLIRQYFKNRIDFQKLKDAYSVYFGSIK